MLLYFKFKNHRSYKDVAEFSMIASSDNYNQEHTFTSKDGDELLKVIGIYGSNASGKSNLIKALAFLKSVVLDSRRTSSTSKIRTSPFRQTGAHHEDKTDFEICLVTKDIRYIYKLSITREEIIHESLTYYPKTHPAEVFSRNKQVIKVGNNFKNLEKYKEETRPNTLFLQVADKWNNEHANNIFNWFEEQLIVVVNNEQTIEKNFRQITEALFKKKGYKEKILKFLRVADPSIRDIEIQNVPIKLSSFPPQIIEVMKTLELPMNEEDMVAPIPKLLHKYDKSKKADKQHITMGDESTGTIRLFDLAGVLLNTLETGGTLFIDELDNELHPKLSNYIIQLFHRKDTNPNNAQLITTTHTTYLLSQAGLRRDQIWFTDKKQDNSSKLYSLAKFKETRSRSNSAHEKAYLEGRYGAIPIIDEDSFDLGITKNA